mmetsp:Transcript_22156/g.58739  ORF Transcript_22156/g.58739 Transcript_22156/m.58739 type:complete len:215 (+) Transcript_22156:335-979(+)
MPGTWRRPAACKSCGKSTSREPSERAHECYVRGNICSPSAPQRNPRLGMSESSAPGVSRSTFQKANTGSSTVRSLEPRRLSSLCNVIPCLYLWRCNGASCHVSLAFGSTSKSQSSPGSWSWSTLTMRLSAAQQAKAPQALSVHLLLVPRALRPPRRNARLLHSCASDLHADSLLLSRYCLETRPAPRERLKCACAVQMFEVPRRFRTEWIALLR